MHAGPFFGTVAIVAIFIINSKRIRAHFRELITAATSWRALKNTHELNGRSNNIAKALRRAESVLLLAGRGGGDARPTLLPPSPVGVAPPWQRAHNTPRSFDSNGRQKQNAESRLNARDGDATDDGSGGGFRRGEKR